MGDVVHRSHITITREHGPTRKAEIRGFGEPVYYGIHGNFPDRLQWVLPSLFPLWSSCYNKLLGYIRRNKIRDLTHFKQDTLF